MQVYEIEEASTCARAHAIASIQIMHPPANADTHNGVRAHSKEKEDSVQRGKIMRTYCTLPAKITHGIFLSNTRNKTEGKACTIYTCASTGKGLYAQSQKSKKPDDWYGRETARASKSR